MKLNLTSAGRRCLHLSGNLFDVGDSEGLREELTRQTTVRKLPDSENGNLPRPTGYLGLDDLGWADLEN